MSRQYSGTMDWSKAYKMWRVYVSGTSYIFRSQNDAMEFIEALNKCAGRISSQLVEHPEGNGTAYLSGYSPFDFDEIEGPEETETIRHSLLPGAVQWHEETKCDGVPRADGGNCGCWEYFYGDKVPEDWQEYVERQEDGTMLEKHICPNCQNKEVKVTYEKVVRCEAK